MLCPNLVRGQSEGSDMRNYSILHRKGNQSHPLSEIYWLGSTLRLSYAVVEIIVRSRATTRIEIANERMTNSTRSVVGYTISDSTVFAVCEPLDISPDIRLKLGVTIRFSLVPSIFSQRKLGV